MTSKMQILFKGKKAWFNEMKFLLNQYSEKVDMLFGKYKKLHIIIEQPFPHLGLVGYARNVETNELRRLRDNEDIINLFKEL